MKLYTLLFAFILHIYLNHFSWFVENDLAGRLNQLTLHLAMFCTEFDLEKCYKFDDVLIKIVDGLKENAPSANAG